MSPAPVSTTLVLVLVRLAPLARRVAATAAPWVARREVARLEAEPRTGPPWRRALFVLALIAAVAVGAYCGSATDFAAPSAVDRAMEAIFPGPGVTP